MFTAFVDHLMESRARVERIDDDVPYFGRIRGFRGVWAQGQTRRECERNLREVLEEWLLLKIRKHQFIPTTRKYDLNVLLRSS
ncbi:type II toxin-antitoxin system HicB family antitoxin [Candidatus Peregrinibacteria bacterium]|nr:type II toxin-antitoxin system HicB family antitoxin [Candidatus Peregrinibacteria bacterium]